MKKILLTATMLVGFAALSQAQQGRVGINTSTPAATLDVVANTTDATRPDALLVPRLTRAQLAAKDAAYTAPQNGALAFVNTLDGTNAGKTVNVTATGFYYYDAPNAVWVAVGGGASGPDISIYSQDGTLAGTRVVTQNNNNLTFTTGKARTIINGNFETQGAVYMRTRAVVGDLTAATWQANDYSIVLSGTSNNISLPDATANPGRVISLTNQTGGNRTFVSGAAFKPQNIAAMQGGKGMIFISDGTTWQTLGGYL
ncbi:hypothetical protein [Chryseobacterium daeguense]|uniref:hypothetical protein n=1 Tax=Chryseobacterium daeguense TaxID=412438 RepID=UPI0004163BFD|nr:hypothetical protein [Chryseobacterium daeguense]